MSSINPQEIRVPILWQNNKFLACKSDDAFFKFWSVYIKFAVTWSSHPEYFIPKTDMRELKTKIYYLLYDHILIEF